MLRISNLIQKIDHFYHTSINEFNLSKIAADPPQTWSMPDDEESPSTERNPGQTQLYDRLLELARAIQDPDVVSEALLIADMYRKALQINGGYNMVKKAIGNFINTQLEDLDPDDEENPLNELESVFNEVYNDLNNRAKEAGGGINKGDELAAEKEIRAVKNQFNEESLKEELSGSNRSTSDLSDIDPEAIAKFDMSGGVSMEDAQTKGRGYFVRTVKEPKDWIQSYENERKRYLEELPNDRDPKVADKKRKLVTLLDQLKLLTAKEAKFLASVQVSPNSVLQQELNEVKEKLKIARREKFLDQIKLLTTKEAELLTLIKNTPDSTIQQDLNQVRDQLKIARKERATLKASIRQDNLSRQSDQLMREYTAAKDPKEKFRLEQELLLRKLLRSQDKNKGGETKLRKQLLAFLPYMSNAPTGVETLKNLLKKIEEASNQKIPIEEVRKEQAAKIKEIKEMGPLQLGFTDMGDFPSILRKLGEHLANVKMGDKKDVIDKWRKKVIDNASLKESTLFRKEINDVASARAAKDQNMLLAAMKALYNKLNETVREFQEYASVIDYRMDKYEKDYKDIIQFYNDVKELNKEGKDKKTKTKIEALINKPELSDEEAAILHTQLQPLINRSAELSKRKYTNPMTGGERLATNILLSNMTQSLTSHLLRTKTSIPEQEPTKNKVKVIDEITGEIMEITEDEIPEYERLNETKLIRQGEYMNKKQRKIALNKINKKAFLDTSVPSEVSQLLNDASLNNIQDPNEYAHQVFQKMLSQMDEKMKKMY